MDIGCGIGGSSRHIARRYGSSGQGITLSPVQAARANALTEEAGLGDRLSFQVADALNQPFSDGVPPPPPPCVSPLVAVCQGVRRRGAVDKSEICSSAVLQQDAPQCVSMKHVEQHRRAGSPC